MIKYFRTLHQLAISNYGRDFDWYIELDGAVLGELIHFIGDSYQVIPKDESSKKMLDDLKLWNQCEFSFRNKVIPKYAKHAYFGYKDQHLSIHVVTITGLCIITSTIIEDILIEIYASIYNTIFMNT